MASHRGYPNGGGGFSAQVADLHCVWCCKKLLHFLQTLGQFDTTVEGIVQWFNNAYVIALQWFRDNLMVAAKGPDPTAAMKVVSNIMEEVWDLKVLCDCQAKDPSLPCLGTCMRTSFAAMGVSIHVGDPHSLWCADWCTHATAVHRV